ncbi:MAG: hypothetical protein ACR2KP_20575 [Egibacteraceae bacterium]
MMLVVKGLEAFYGRSHVLHDVALEAHAGSWWRCSAATAPARRRCCPH